MAEDLPRQLHTDRQVSYIRTGSRCDRRSSGRRWPLTCMCETSCSSFMRCCGMSPVPIETRQSTCAHMPTALSCPVSGTVSAQGARTCAATCVAAKPCSELPGAPYSAHASYTAPAHRLSSRLQKQQLVYPSFIHLQVKCYL